VRAAEPIVDGSRFIDAIDVDHANFAVFPFRRGTCVRPQFALRN
jgi:hypothetical protein